MPQSQQTPTGGATPPVIELPGSFEDADIALGCECAHPSLQIERWLQECTDGERR